MYDRRVRTWDLVTHAARPRRRDQHSFQNAELYLTAAQSLFGVAVLISLKFNRTSGLLLLLLFLSQFIVQQIRIEVAGIYLIFAAVYIFKARESILPTIKTGLFSR